jgi:hypothetical protein
MPVSFSPRRSYVEYEPPWYSKPKYYIPIAAVVTLVLAVGIYWLVLAADLSQQAASYDLRELEKMESASVIVDRNDKIFGQIYVENRETIPYSELPRDLVNAGRRDGGHEVLHAQRLRSVRHHPRGAQELHRGGVKQGASTVTQQLARNTFALSERTFRRKLVEIFLARRIEQQFGQAEDHGALPEPDLLRRRTLRRGGGVARLLRETGEGDDAHGSGDAGGIDQEPESPLAVDGPAGLEGSAERGAESDERSRVYLAGAGRPARRRKRS